MENTICSLVGKSALAENPPLLSKLDNRECYSGISDSGISAPGENEEDGVLERNEELYRFALWTARSLLKDCILMHKSH